MVDNILAKGVEGGEDQTLSTTQPAEVANVSVLSEI